MALSTVRSVSVVVDTLLIVTLIGGFCNFSMFCCAFIIFGVFECVFMQRKKCVTLCPF